MLALAEACLQGVSTRKINMVTRQLMGKEFSSAPISQVVGMDTAWSETGGSWDHFIVGLGQRGLKIDQIANEYQDKFPEFA